MEGYQFSTGLPGLDRVLKGILAGDNVVWQIDRISDYQSLVEPCVAWARESGRPLVYFRFAAHTPLLQPEAGCQIHELDPAVGFEGFVSAMHDIIGETGRGATYIFDCLSPLAESWYSDVMLGNFFKLICPYLFDMETLAYFALYRNHHSAYALEPIGETTQLFLDVYHHDHTYVRPMKVQHRYSATMNMLHRFEADGSFTPVSNSAEIAGLMTTAKWSGLHADRKPGFWESAFIDAHNRKQHIADGQLPPEAEQDAFTRLLPMVITRDETIAGLARQYLTLDDILDVRRRMIGSGLIGGKAVGMLLARAILRKQDAGLYQQLEPHDSFFVGSDVFYSYLVQNGIWWTRQKQRDPAAFYEHATRARRLIITGTFPAHTLRQFEEMVDYFGQSPFIVRSSSLLEDNYGHAFAGKYESVFCANQGPRTQRIEDFVAAVKTIYASAMSEKALRYRSRHGMLEQDEQMALLVMRVSGRTVGRRFYPPAAGVGFSFNPYVWHPDIDPEAGVIRLVAGLGTRAVDRSDDDCTRIVALNAPERRPEHGFDAVRARTQQRMDFIDLEANHHATGAFYDLVPAFEPDILALLAPEDREAVRRARGSGRKLVQVPRLLTFDPLLQTGFTETMRRILHVLQASYAHPVDIEFTVNFGDDGEPVINLVQCRPLQVQGAGTIKPEDIPKPEQASEYLIRSESAVIGLSRVLQVDSFVYVVPEQYSALPMRDRYEVARVLGTVTQALQARNPDGQTVMLGPGRWGTSSPELGVPVTFQDICGVAVIVEIVTMHDGLMPDVSLGTHFLNELVEMNMLYLCLSPGQAGCILAEPAILGAQTILDALVPDAGRWHDVIRVVPAAALAGTADGIYLLADARKQHVDCFVATDLQETAS